MIPLEEFRAENNEIRDLCAILDVSVDRSELKDNSIVCELLERLPRRSTLIWRMKIAWFTAIC